MSFQMYSSLVTGASGLIGAAICRELVKTGMTVFGCGRRVEIIQALSEDAEILKGPGCLKAIKCDFSDINAVHDMMDHINDSHGALRVLVHNTRMMKKNHLIYGEPSDWQKVTTDVSRIIKTLIDPFRPLELIRTNLSVPVDQIILDFLNLPKNWWTEYLSPIHPALDRKKANVLSPSLCSREALLMMKSFGIDDGHIINIFSTPKNFSNCGIYYATQAMAYAVTETLRQQIKDVHMETRVSTISPKNVNIKPGQDLERMPKLLDADEVGEIVRLLISLPANKEGDDLFV